MPSMIQHIRHKTQLMRLLISLIISPYEVVHMGNQNSCLKLILVILILGAQIMANITKATEMDQRISNWLNCGEYRSDIDQVLTNIVRGAELATSESETAQVFQQELYYLIRSKIGKEPVFNREKSVSGIVHNFGSLKERKSGRGRLDAVVNSLIIEYKHNSKLKSQRQKSEATEQVIDYLVALYKKDKIKYSAILTDGLYISYFSFLGETVEHTKLRVISVDDIDVIVKAILNNSTKKFDPVNIVRDFSVSSHSESESRKFSRVLFEALSNNCTEKTEMLYEEWKGLMHLSVEDNGKSGDIEKRRHDLSAIFATEVKDAETEYKALYALQTTYAVIVKLIACKVVDSLRFHDEAREYRDLVDLNSEKLQRFLQQMEDGYSYSNMGIRNFLEGDFFSWYADEHQWNTGFFKSVKELVYRIDEYSSFSLEVKYDPVDVFKDLYMGIIPQSIRHSMGEYFTPEWLADCVVSSAISKFPDSKKWRAVDPCCGSGIFIISLIKKIVGDIRVADLNRAEKFRMVEEIIDRVHGIDINPLSVLSARVSYYLALHRLGDVSDVEIPIYLGDSAIIPTMRVVDGNECYFYAVNNLKCKSFNVLLPRRIVERADFGKMMSGLQSLVKAENADLLANKIKENLTVEELASETLIAAIDELSGSLVELHRKKWDGIWIRIAMNFMMIARLKAFDMIVGNPPWVKWEHLPAAYTKKIKEFCDVRHIFCNDGGMFGGAQLNICALIANVTAANWLTDDGVLAFLMPDSIMSQNSYEEFRNFYIDYSKGSRLYLQSIDRWMPPLRPFKVGNKSVMQDFNTYYFASNAVDYADGVPVREISKIAKAVDAEINSCQNFESAKRYLVVRDGLARQMATNSTAFTYVSDKYDFRKIVGPSAYLYRTGVESTPFEVFKLVAAGESRRKSHYKFKNKILKTSKYKVDDMPIDGWDLPVEFIYPMLEGPCVKPFSYSCGDNYHIVPYDKNNTTTPVPLKNLMSDNEDLAAYFSDHRYILDKQSEKSKAMHRGDEFYALSKIGPYTFAPYIVAARDNSYFCASVVGPTITAWGEVKTTICVKHTIIISQDVEGNMISEDEAHYINGVLNSCIVHEYIHSTFKTNGFSLNKSKLFLPKFDRQVKEFMEIAKISKRASCDPGYREEACSILSDAYLRLCERYNGNVKKEIEKRR